MTMQLVKGIHMIEVHIIRLAIFIKEYSQEKELSTRLAFKRLKEINVSGIALNKVI